MPGELSKPHTFNSRAGKPAVARRADRSMAEDLARSADAPYSNPSQDVRHARPSCVLHRAVADHDGSATAHLSTVDAFLSSASTREPGRPASARLASPSRRYLVWRVADLSRFVQADSMYGGRRQRGRPIMDMHNTGERRERNPWKETVCSCCGEPVWHQPEHAVGRRVVCWPCAEGENP